MPLVKKQHTRSVSLPRLPCSLKHHECASDCLKGMVVLEAASSISLASHLKCCCPCWCRWMPALMLGGKYLLPPTPMSGLESTGKYTQPHLWCKTGKARSLMEPQTFQQPASLHCRAITVCRCSPSGKHSLLAVE